MYLVAIGYIIGSAVMGMTVGFGLCWVWIVHKMRYRDPQLHPGKWVRAGMGTWQRIDSPSKAEVARKMMRGTHEHAAAVCVLTDHLAHEDRCVCCAKRYGIFGSWQEPLDAHR